MLDWRGWCEGNDNRKYFLGASYAAEPTLAKFPTSVRFSTKYMGFGHLEKWMGEQLEGALKDVYDEVSGAFIKWVQISDIDYSDHLTIINITSESFAGLSRSTRIIRTAPGRNGAKRWIALQPRTGVKKMRRT